jgi:hypothetical protein
MRSNGISLGDGRKKFQPYGVDVAGKEEGQAGATEKQEGQPFSQGGWPSSFFTATEAVSA